MKEKSLENQRHADEHSKLRIVKFYGFNQLKLHHQKMKNMTQKAEESKVKSLLQWVQVYPLSDPIFDMKLARISFIEYLL